MTRRAEGASRILTNSIIAALRELPTMVRAGFAENSREILPFSQLPSGLPKGALVEISGPVGGGKTELVLKFLAENPAARVAWVEENFTVYPVVFPRAKVQLERVLFVDATPGSQEALWTSHQILRSGIFEVLVLIAHSCDEMALRRLQLAAEKSGTTLILMNEEPTREGTWPIALQLEVHRCEMGSPKIQIVKHRGQYLWQAQSQTTHAF